MHFARIRSWRGQNTCALPEAKTQNRNGKNSLGLSSPCALFVCYGALLENTADCGVCLYSVLLVVKIALVFYKVPMFNWSSFFRQLESAFVNEFI